MVNSRLFEILSYVICKIMVIIKNQVFQILVDGLVSYLGTIFLNNTAAATAL